MCDPVTAVMALQTGAQFIQGSQASRASRDAADVATRQAREAARDRTEAISRRGALAQESAAADIEQASRRGAQARAQARVAAAESGAAGSSVAALLQDFQRQEAEFAFRRERNLGTELAGLDQEGRALSRQTGARLQQIEASVVPQPNFFNALLRVGAGALQQRTAAQGRLDNA